VTNADRLRSGVSDVVAVQIDAQLQLQNQLQARRNEVEALQRQAQMVERAQAQQGGAGPAKAATPQEERAKEVERDALAQQQKALLERQVVLEQQLAQVAQNAAAQQRRQVPVAANDLFIAAPAAGNVVYATTAANAADDSALVAEKEAIWTAALRYTLTEEQQSRLSAAELERSSLPSTSNFERVFNEVDQKLLLDRAQRDKLAPLVRQVANRPSVESQFNRSPLSEVATNVMRALPEDQLKSILSEPQRAQHERLIAPPTTTPANRNRTTINNGAIIIRDAPVAPPAIDGPVAVPAVRRQSP
jgi:hypothetical protein